MQKLPLLLLITFWYIGSISAQLYAQEGSFVIIETPQKLSKKERDARDKVAQQWNIFFKESCHSPSDLETQDSIALANGMTYYQLSQKYGQDWNEKFKKEVAQALDLKPEMTETLHLKTDSISEYSLQENSYVQEAWYEGLTPYPYQKDIEWDVLSGSTNGILFKGQDNVMKLHFAGDTRYKLLAHNCVVSKRIWNKTLHPLEFNIQSSNNQKEAFLQIISDRGDTSTLGFTVTFMPLASLHVGTYHSEKQISLGSLVANDRVFVAYPPDLGIKGDLYEVIEWEIQVADKRVGPVNRTPEIGSEMLQILQGLPVDSKVTLYYKTKSKTDLVRTSYVDFTLVP